MCIGGEQHGGFAAKFLHGEHGGVMEIRRCLARDVLDHVQRDHLSRDLGKALHPARDHDHAIVVDFDDVARVVPAFADGGLGRFDHAGIGIAVIAEHQVGPAEVQQATLVDALDRLDPVFHAGQETAHRAAAICRRCGQ